MLFYLQSIQYWNHLMWLGFVQFENQKRNEESLWIESSVEDSSPKMATDIEQVRQSYFLERRVFM